MIPFSVTEAVKERRSVRTYEDKPVSQELLDKILQYSSSLTNPLGLPVAVHMVHKDIDNAGEKLGTYGVIKGATTFLGLSVPQDLMALVAGGYQFEQLVLYITSLGLGTVWLAATFSRTRFQKSMGIPDTDWFPAICPVGYPKKIRLVEKLMRMGVGADSRKPWSQLFFDTDFTRELDQYEAGVYAEALDMLRLAPSATNAQPWRVLKAGDTFHFYLMYKDKAGDDDIRIKHVDLGICLSHFCLTLEQTRGLKGEFVVEEPGAVQAPSTFHYVLSVKF